jgi:diguanylate cyclase (GGDEF)-like protein
MREVLREQSIRDALTGLYNRRYMEEVLWREISRAEREGEPLAVIMADIDHFKRLNDLYGHANGDQVLGIISGILEKGIRTGDIACRYGGEEFILIMPRANMAVTLERAESLREQVMKTQLGIDEIDNEIVTISLGVAIFRSMARQQMNCCKPPIRPCTWRKGPDVTG